MRRIPSTAALAVLVLLSTIVRAWAGLRIPTPWIAADEMIYAEIGRSLWETGHLDILGQSAPFYSLVHPALIGLPLLLFSQALSLNDATAGYVNGIIAGVFGYYFGARSTAGDAATTRRLGEALAGHGRQAESLRDENAAMRTRAAEAANAGARPGQGVQHAGGQEGQGCRRR